METKEINPFEGKTIIYIIGAGRSGTTLLDILLGNGNNISSRGEINRFAKRDGVPPKSHENSEKFRYWTNIKDHIQNDTQSYKLEYINSLHQQFEYHAGYIFGKIVKKLKKKEYTIYNRFIKSIYTEIFKSTHEDIIIESSKYPGRANNLSEILPCEIKYIYLQRDPVAVVNAFTKKNVEQPSKSYLSANLYYFIVNLLCKRALNNLNKKHQVAIIKYEDLLNDPLRELTILEKKININLTDVKSKLANNQALTVGYLFDGNRIRNNETIFFLPSKHQYSNSARNSFTRFLNNPLYQ